jgi:hypothetical protein
LTTRPNQFERVVHDNIPTNQWVTTQPVDLRDAKYEEVKSLNDLMKHGVQIYQLSDDYDAWTWHENNKTLKTEKEFLDDLRASIETGKIRWMNQERDISPSNFNSEIKTNPPIQSQKFSL